jgi:RNA polymerase sigma-70 factor, ECF subfamily
MSPLQGDRYSGGLPVAGDRDLAGPYWERVRLFALRRVGDAAMAEDLAQETLRVAGAALREGRVQNPDALPAFIFQTARNLCLQRHRSDARETRAMGRLQAEHAGQTRPPDALLLMVGEERCAAVRLAITRLESGDRRLLELLYFDDLPTADVSARLGVTPEALRVRKHRALRRLGVALGDAPDVTP